MEYKEFYEKINFVPHWVKDEGDLRKFCRHMIYRYLCEKNKSQKIISHLEKNHKKIYCKEIIDIELSSTLELDHLYENPPEEPEDPFKSLR